VSVSSGSTTHSDLVGLVAQHVDLPLHVDALDLGEEFLPKRKARGDIAR
jgi:hypothetical protein